MFVLSCKHQSELAKTTTLKACAKKKKKVVKGGRTKMYLWRSTRVNVDTLEFPECLRLKLSLSFSAIHAEINWLLDTCELNKKKQNWKWLFTQE